MRSALLQEVVTIRGSGTTAVTQTEGDWLDLGPYADVVFWIEITEVTNPGGGTVSLSFETAPVALESLFVPVDSPLTAVASNTVTVRKVLMNAAGRVPLARFLRWKVQGSTSGTWDITFRVYVTLGEGVRSAFSPLSLPGLRMWLRADLGVSLSGTSVTDWKDQSGNGNHVTQATAGNRPRFEPNATALNGRPALDFASSKFMDNTLSNIVTSAGSAYSVLVVAQNGNGSLLSIRRSQPFSTSRFQLANTYVFTDGTNAAADITVSNTLFITQSAVSGFYSCHRYKGAGLNPDIYLEGLFKTITSVGTNQTTEAGATGFYVGRNAVADYWNGLIAEIIVTGNAITDADRLRVEAYQREYFGV